MDERTRYEHLQHTVDELERRLCHLEVRIKELEGLDVSTRLGNLERELAHAWSMYVSMANSRSWRMTAPLRALSRRLKGLVGSRLFLSLFYRMRQSSVVRRIASKAGVSAGALTGEGGSSLGWVNDETLSYGLSRRGEVIFSLLRSHGSGSLRGGGDL